MARIEVRGLTKRFGEEEVLKGVDLAVEAGEIFGLIGPSGSGKSTLMRALTGHLPPSEGEAEVMGTAPAGFGRAERRRIGFMPQGFVLYDQLSVRQNLGFVAGLYGLGLRERWRRVRETLEFVELWEHRRKTAANISGGMRRRLQLAAAIVHEPEVLFVDEPTANLDPILRRRFWEEFRQLRDDGRTLFVTTQYVGEAELCDRVGLLSDGRLLAVGTPGELRRRAFGGEIVRVALGGDPGTLGGRLEALGKIGRVLEVRQDPDAGEAVSHIRILADDADAAMPRVLEALKGADVRSLDVPEPPFDEVFFRLLEPSDRPVSAGSHRRIDGG